MSEAATSAVRQILEPVGSNNFRRVCYDSFTTIAVPHVAFFFKKRSSVPKYRFLYPKVGPAEPLNSCQIFAYLSRTPKDEKLSMWPCSVS